MSRSSFNQRNPAVKRIQQEMKEMSEHRSADFIAEALETDIFEWHFVVRGPKDSEFEGGIFHGRILLPPDYPFKPPAFMMLSPSGRFETGMKICLSISSHHPEHWQPSWSIRTALTALIAFMPTPGNSALGSLDFTKDERRVMAAASRAAAPKFGSAERQKVSDEMHQRMVDMEVAPPPPLPIKVEPVPAEVLEGQLPLPSPPPPPGTSTSPASEQDKASGTPDVTPVANVTASMLLDFARTADGEAPAATADAAAATVAAVATSPPRTSATGTTSPAAAATALPSPPHGRVSSTPAAAVPQPGRVSTVTAAAAAAAAPAPAAVAVESPSERGLTLLAYGLMLAIFAILAKKAFNFWGSMALDLPVLD